MNRGQIASQIFTYILGIVVVGLLLLIGLRAVDTIGDRSCDVQATKFATALATTIEKNKAWGINKVAEFVLPCGATRVCVVDRSVIDAVKAPGESAALDAMEPQFGGIVRSVQSDVAVNVFTETDGLFEPVSRFEDPAPITLPDDEPIRCFNGEPTRIRFRGQGRAVELEQS